MFCGTLQCTSICLFLKKIDFLYKKSCCLEFYVLSLFELKLMLSVMYIIIVFLSFQYKFYMNMDVQKMQAFACCVKQETVQVFLFYELLLMLSVMYISFFVHVCDVCKANGSLVHAVFNLTHIFLTTCKCIAIYVPSNCFCVL